MRDPWEPRWTTDELRAISTPEPTEPTGSPVTRLADDVDRVQSELILARTRAHNYEQAADFLGRLVRRYRRDRWLFFLAGLLLGSVGLALALYLVLP